MKVIPRLVELPGGAWVNPAHVEAVSPQGRSSAEVWFVNGNLTFNGVESGDIARAINEGIERNTLEEVEK